MSDSESMYHFKKGQEAFDRQNTLLALFHFEQIPSSAQTPAILSSLAVCIAKEKNSLRRGLELCRKAMELEPGNPLHYLHLGRIYILAKKKHLAIITFQKGLKCGRHQGIINELRQMGKRRAPVFPSLGRKHLLNKYLGYLTDRLGIH